MPRKQILAAAGAILAVVPLLGCETMPAAQTEPTPPPPVVLEFAGSWGERGSEPGQLSQPLALATDSDGLVYIADAANNSIEKFGSRGEPRLSFTDARLRLPTGLAVDRGGAIYFADRRANFVFVYSPEGKPSQRGPAPAHGIDRAKHSAANLSLACKCTTGVILFASKPQS